MVDVGEAFVGAANLTASRHVLPTMHGRLSGVVLLLVPGINASDRASFAIAADDYTRHVAHYS